MSFASETTIKAIRKPRPCDGCGRRIEIGEPAIRWAGTTDGDFGTALYHPDCRAAEVAMNYDVLGYHYGDDWWPLSDIESEDRPWLIDAYPVVAQRLFTSDQLPENPAIRSAQDIPSHRQGGETT